MAVLTGFTSKTAQNLQLDAGILVKNHTVGGEITEANKLGATEGGATFAAVPTIRNLFDGLDGAKGNYKDGNVIDTWDITLTASVSELTADNIKMAIAAADVTKTTPQGYDTITPRNEIKTEDYLKSICWIGTMNGSEKPMVIEVLNVMNFNGFNFTATDKGRGKVDLELKAHFDLTKPDEVPFKIYLPTIGA